MQWDGQAFGRAVQHARKSQGLTQEQLGERLGISGQAVSKWENGESTPDLPSLPLICEVLETSADALLGTEQTAGLDSALRALPDRLAGLSDAERPRLIGPTLARVLARINAENNIDRWAGHDFFVFRKRVDWQFRYATLVTQNAGVIHVHGQGDLVGADVLDAEIARGLALLADEQVVHLLRRLLQDGMQCEAVKQEAQVDPAVRTVCDRLTDAGYLSQNRLGYEITPFGALIAGAILTLARTPGMFPRDERLRRALIIAPDPPK